MKSITLHWCTALLLWGAHDSIAQLVNSNLTSAVKGNVVDLGYSQYQGFVDRQSNLEFYLGIRYASPPGRWQAPVKPGVNRTSVIQANTYGPQCYQSDSGGPRSAAHDYSGSEDCLFLNVWKPTEVTDPLPVLVWIHGGGYGLLNSRSDPTFLQQITDTRFVFVSIGYRLGAFGFLSSAEVKKHGSLNAGLLDQNRALNWIQEHIRAFGGNPEQVTLFGESAGAGSVTQHLLSYGGSLGTTLFKNAILASPYLPKQYRYDDTIPAKSYQQFASAAGCSYSPQNYDGVFACLSGKDSHVLANASQMVSSSAFPGTWAFTPVVDGTFIQDFPTRQLASGKLNGQATLVGNNAHEGNTFAPQNITTSEQFLDFVRTYLPNLNVAGIASLLRYYPEPPASGALYSTQYERTARFVGDAQFTCPGNWIADAAKVAYRYSYDVPAAYHGLDVPNYLPDQSKAQVFPSTFNNFSAIFDQTLVSFMINGTPFNKALDQPYPLWSTPIYGAQVDFNVSAPVTIPFTYGLYPINLAISGDPNVTIESGLQMTNGLDRCDFWRSIAVQIPI